MASLLHELRRRNVFRVAALYIVVSWLVLQVADVVTEFLPLPGWTGQLVFVLLALGFPMAMVFAWAYELTPQGIKRESEVEDGRSTTRKTGRKLDFLIIGLLAVAVLYLLFDKFRSDAEPDVRPPATAAKEQPAEGGGAAKSIAVLPFVNMSDDSANEYFSDGISEEILNVLVDVDGLRVTSRTSAFAFKDSTLGLPEIARQLNVDHVLEGSVRKAGDRVRITAQLIDVESDSHLWSETFERDLEDIFAIQKEIATSIVEALQVAMGAAASEVDVGAPTDDMEAYETYLQARHLIHNRGTYRAEGLRRAIELLTETVEKDPAFAEAWAGLGAAHVLYPGYAGTPLEDSVGPAEAAIARAIELDPKVGEAHAALGLLRSDQARWGEAERHLTEAIRVDPQFETAYVWYGILLTVSGKSEQAREVLLLAADKDPASAIGAHWLADIYRNLGDMESSREMAERSVRLGMTSSVMGVYIYHLRRGDMDAAAAAMREYADGFGVEPDFVQPLLAAVSDPDELPPFEAVLDEVLKENPDFYHAWMYYDIDHVERLLEIIERELSQGRANTMLYRAWEPWLADLRAHPRFAELMEQVGLMDYWRATGWPDLCRASQDRLVCD